MVKVLFPRSAGCADPAGRRRLWYLCLCQGWPFYQSRRNGRMPGQQGRHLRQGACRAQWVYSPDRLAIRSGERGQKGQGQFEKISWDDAITQIAEVLTQQKKAYGAHSLAILAPSKRAYSDYLKRFLTAHGSPNYGHSGICAMQRAFAFMYTLGDYPRPDVAHSDLIICWGRSPSIPVPWPVRHGFYGTPETAVPPSSPSSLRWNRTLAWPMSGCPCVRERMRLWPWPCCMW